MKKYLPLLGLSVGILPLMMAHAAEKHVHGEADLFVAVQGSKVLVELATPADNLVGFEYHPKTEAQHEVVEAAEKTLQDYRSVVQFPNGSCKLVKADIHSPFEEHEGEHDEHDHGDHKDHDEHDHDDHKDHDEHDHDDHKDHDEHDHDGHKDHDEHGHDDHKDHDEHDHDGHKDHDEHDHDDHKDHDEHGHDDHEGHDHDEHEGHSSFSINYELTCDSLEALEASVFTSFPRFQKLQVNWVLDSGQGSKTLSADKNKLTFN